jgi:hypothetical protein
LALQEGHTGAIATFGEIAVKARERGWLTNEQLADLLGLQKG